MKGLAALHLFPSGCCARPLAKPQPGSTHTSHGASSPFHIALLSSKTCGFPRHANLEIRVTCANFFQLSKIFVPITTSVRNVSAPGGAHWRFGAAIAIQICPKIKNPASSAGHVRPFALGCLYSRSLPNGYARSSIFLYPVCVTNLTSS
jgi:hypothetical protein